MNHYLWVTSQVLQCQVMVRCLPIVVIQPHAGIILFWWHHGNGTCLFTVHISDPFAMVKFCGWTIYGWWSSSYQEGGYKVVTLWVDGSVGVYYHYTDECYAVEYNSRGIVGMANSGHNTNSSQFYITLKATPWMDIVCFAFEWVYIYNFIYMGYLFT